MAGHWRLRSEGRGLHWSELAGLDGRKVCARSMGCRRRHVGSCCHTNWWLRLHRSKSSHGSWDSLGWSGNGGRDRLRLENRRRLECRDGLGSSSGYGLGACTMSMHVERGSRVSRSRCESGRLTIVEGLRRVGRCLALGCRSGRLGIGLVNRRKLSRIVGLSDLERKSMINAIQELGSVEACRSL